MHEQMELCSETTAIIFILHCYRLQSNPFRNFSNPFLGAFWPCEIGLGKVQKRKAAAAKYLAYS